MSYILDALKKSERERERGALPSLSTAPRVPFSGRPASTGIGVGAGIVACLVAAGWLVSLYWLEDRPAPDAAATGGPGAEERPAGDEAPAAPVADGSTPEASGASVEQGAATGAAEPDVVPELDADAREIIEGLTVNVVSYSDVPERRFVMLDQRIFRESETVADGIVVKRILPDGALLAAGGREVMVRPD